MNLNTEHSEDWTTCLCKDCGQVRKGYVSAFSTKTEGQKKLNKRKPL